MFKRGDRRATAVVQLGWISVFLIGIFIIVFFIGFSSKQKDLNEKIITTKISYNLDSIFNRLKISNKQNDKILLPQEIELNFDCETGTFTIDDQSSPYPEDSILFSKYMKTKDIIVISKDWNKPFFVTNFLYLASSNQDYILVYPNNLFSFVNNFYNELPENLNKEMLLFGKPFVDKKFNNVIIGFFSQYTANPQIIGELNKLPSSFLNKKITVIEFILNKNKIRFFEKTNNVWKATPEMDYYDTETMTGALFSDSSLEYFCTMSKALQNLKNTVKEMQTKISVLKPTRPDCPYASIDAKLNALLTTTDSYSLNLIVDDINEYNKNLEMKSCPMLY